MKDKEYTNFDFGFSAVDEQDIISNATHQVKFNHLEIQEKLKAKITQLKSDKNEMFRIFKPLLQQLLDTADKPIIKWPNRGPEIKKMIEKLVELVEE